MRSKFTELNSKTSLVDVIRVCQVVEAIKRIPNVRTGATFFSVHDVWLFDATLDSKVCPFCRMYEEAPEWNGNVLRSEFPHLEIIDENTIHPHVHPNCRCTLKRKLAGD